MSETLTTHGARMYQIVDWDANFEGAKSRTYSNKTTCQMPTKHGLGYKRLVKRQNGAALFGAWCALVQVCSRHHKERDGYCTDTGKPDGKPYSTTDLELLTDIPAVIFVELFQVATSKEVAWLRILQGQYEDITGSLHSDLDLDSNLDSNSIGDVQTQAPAQPKKEKVVDPIKWTSETKWLGITNEDYDSWEIAYPAIVIDTELEKATQWLLSNPKKAHKKGWRKFITGWFGRAQERGRS